MTPSSPNSAVALVGPAASTGGPAAEYERARGSLALLTLAALIRRWRTVVGTALATGAVALAIALLTPRAYVTGTLLVPFLGAGARGGVAGAGLPANVAGLLGLGAGPAGGIMQTVLGSATLAEAVIKRVARTPDEERAVAEVLGDGLRIQRNADGSMVVQVRASDPQLAARIANMYPVVLNQVLARLNVEGTRVKQDYLRVQLDSAQRRLGESSQRLIEFQQRRSIPALDQQAARSVEAVASIEQAISEQELAIQQLRRTATEDNPELRAAVAQLAARRDQLARLKRGTGGGGSSVFVPFERGSELRVASTEVEREYQQDQRVYASLAAALLDAEIDASNSLPVLTVLDQAPVPGKPARPAWVTATLGLTLGLVLGVVVVLASHLVDRLRAEPANDEFFATWDQVFARKARAAGRASIAA